jgi:two-component system OmpR family response regulator
MSESAHILVVDDQKDICDVVQDYLAGEGYRVTTANDGATMRRIIAQSAIDLVPAQAISPARTAGARQERAAPRLSAQQ